MKNVLEYIESGILELYVMGNTTAEESKEVELMAIAHPEVKNEIEKISEILELCAFENAVTPNSTIKPFLMATIDYTERLKSGEPASVPPVLSEVSKIEEYAAWLKRDDMKAPSSFEGIHAKIIGFTPHATTAIVWIKELAPHEVHDNEHEKFLIVEGTCDIIVGEDVYHMVPGDYFSVPLHKTHLIKVTSTIPCKVILQRLAA